MREWMVASVAGRVFCAHPARLIVRACVFCTLMRGRRATARLPQCWDWLCLVACPTSCNLSIMTRVRFRVQGVARAPKRASSTRVTRYYGSCDLTALVWTIRASNGEEPWQRRTQQV